MLHNWVSGFFFFPFVIVNFVQQTVNVIVNQRDSFQVCVSALLGQAQSSPYSQGYTSTAFLGVSTKCPGCYTRPLHSDWWELKCLPGPCGLWLLLSSQHPCGSSFPDGSFWSLLMESHLAHIAFSIWPKTPEDSWAGFLSFFFAHITFFFFWYPAPQIPTISVAVSFHLSLLSPASPPFFVWAPLLLMQSLSPGRDPGWLGGSCPSFLFLSRSCVSCCPTSKNSHLEYFL